MKISTDVLLELVWAQTYHQTAQAGKELMTYGINAYLIVIELGLMDFLSKL